MALLPVAEGDDFCTCCQAIMVAINHSEICCNVMQTGVIRLPTADAGVVMSVALMAPMTAHNGRREVLYARGGGVVIALSVGDASARSKQNAQGDFGEKSAHDESPVG